MALIQTTVDDKVKERADAVFARNGLTTPMACRIMVTQVANEGRSPFDGLFSRGTAVELAEDVRRDMVYAEAVELGLLPDDTEPDPTEVPADILDGLGLAPEEVGQ
ncbi:type II toxin-antitoxin system RelB/DinJ family antitoxin [Thermophilibacter sp.]